VLIIWLRTVSAKTVFVRALTYVGKIIGLLGAICFIGSFTALATDAPASVRLLHFVWALVVGVALLAAGIWVMRRSKH
jgi:hypothetical protein